MRGDFRWYGNKEKMLICWICFRETNDAATSCHLAYIQTEQHQLYHMCLRCGERDLVMVHRP